MGLTSVFQGAVYLADPANAPLWSWLAGVAAVLSGAALVVGLLTPFGAGVVAAGVVGTAFTWIPAPMPNLLDSRLATLFALIMAAAILFLGPGAFSVDARLFGRREIVIPLPRSR